MEGEVDFIDDFGGGVGRVVLDGMGWDVMGRKEVCVR